MKLSTLRSLLGLLLLHLGCFVFSPATQRRRGEARRRRSERLSPSRLKRATARAASLSRLFAKRLFHCAAAPTPPERLRPSAPSPCSSSRSLTKSIFITSASPEKLFQGRVSGPGYYTRPELYPCGICGEIFHGGGALEQHRFSKHAISELVEGDSGHNVVRMIFKSGWPVTAKKPVVNRVLKIHSSPKILARFEEYRERVKSRAARRVARRGGDERCIADGNELLRFYCTTFLCDLSGGACGHQYCSVCGIIRTGFSVKMDGIPTQPSGWKAHRAVPEEIEEEFKFMNVKRAVIVCRVVAGRVGCDPGLAGKEDPSFDSYISGVGPRSDGEDELWVFNPTAVLPCFVIVYTV
ncbi:unnamed protein product [Cuscuta campestris]|uniref:C2H2-type domain-containing protein n=1 Tax=Cuscuta campestris TaxID=132261 RepID=A0A484MS64_9ASTE|nr:unnamed protein product [Cuscuta campestris]